jgi:phage terminase large subunit-like protein
VSGMTWIAGLDPAFSGDPFGLAIVGRKSGERKLRLGVARSWKTSKNKKTAGFDERRAFEDDILHEVAELCRQYKVRVVVTDQYAAPQVKERLTSAGLYVETCAMTAQSKTAAFGELRARLLAGELELYDHPPLLAELRRLRTKYTAGSATVVNPRVGGSHGDQAQALALAVWQFAGPVSSGEAMPRAGGDGGSWHHGEGLSGGQVRDVEF